ncbi:hypothetical protein BJV78DRAFT_144193 [Lactifluus subvellereus]|nr:hypothetical protein BJV78DRAFT_144193 [Lactifluus subvellereus]
MPPPRALNFYNLNSMSQFRGRNFNHDAMPTAAVSTGLDEHHSPPNPPQSVHNKVPPHVGSNSARCPEVSFCTYLEREEEKGKLADSQQEDANDILLFGALLSATVATLVGASIESLRPDPRDKWAFYLAKSLELLADGDKSQIPVLPPLADPSQFSPSTPVVLINSLWFLSLGVSLTCILLASLPRRWVRRYSDVLAIRPRPDSHDLARTRRVFDAEDDGDQLSLPWLIEALPTLLRAALYLFFAGFGVLVFNLTANLGIAQAILLTTGSLICPVLCFQHP